MEHFNHVFQAIHSLLQRGQNHKMRGGSKTAALHPISRRRLPLQRPKGVSGRGMRVPPFFCV
ncbi:hypothetical protein EPB69_06420 [Geobacillus stearothermophilus]|nr:hypothetical protein EPB69_06420 [Geobacillus stearothermophilus]